MTALLVHSCSSRSESIAELCAAVGSVASVSMVICGIMGALASTFSPAACFATIGGGGVWFILESSWWCWKEKGCYNEKEKPSPNFLQKQADPFSNGVLDRREYLQSLHSSPKQQEKSTGAVLSDDDIAAIQEYARENKVSFEEVLRTYKIFSGDEIATIDQLAYKNKCTFEKQLKNLDQFAKDGGHDSIQSVIQKLKTEPEGQGTGLLSEEYEDFRMQPSEY